MSEVQTIQIGNVKYDVKSITDAGARLINDIKKIENEINHLNLQISINNVALNTLSNELSKELPNFVIVDGNE